MYSSFGVILRRYSVSLSGSDWPLYNPSKTVRNPKKWVQWEKFINTKSRSVSSSAMWLATHRATYLPIWIACVHKRILIDLTLKSLETKKEKKTWNQFSVSSIGQSWHEQQSPAAYTAGDEILCIHLFTLRPLIKLVIPYLRCVLQLFWAAFKPRLNSN